MQIKRLFNIISAFIILMSYSTEAVAATAESVLNAAAEKYRNSLSLTANFTITSGGNSSNGTITVAKDKFLMVVPQMKIWYNGRTQWTYSPETNEVNITEPTAEELQQVNPFAIVSSFRQSYNSKMMKSAAGTNRVQLTPINKSDEIKSVVVTFDASTHYPKDVTITSGNNSVVKITVTGIKAGGKLPESQFTFDKKKYPDAEIVDLR